MTTSFPELSQTFHDGQIVILNLSIEAAQKINIEVIKNMLAKGLTGIYITLIHSCYQICEDFTKNNIDISKLFFIDGISRLYGNKEVPTKNVAYVPGPLALEKIVEETNKQLSFEPTNKSFVIVDCLTGLLLYNSTEKITDFLEKLQKTIKLHKVVGFIILYNKGNPPEDLIKYFDETAKVINIPA